MNNPVNPTTSAPQSENDPLPYKQEAGGSWPSPPTTESATSGDPPTTDTLPGGSSAPHNSGETAERPVALDLRDTHLVWDECGFWLMLGDLPLAEISVENCSHLDLIEALLKLRREDRRG